MDFDISHVTQVIQPYGVLVAGALFGSGWWIWVDAIVYSAAALGVTVNPVYHIPGIVASLAVIIMGSIRRDDAYGDTSYGDEDVAVSCWLNKHVHVTAVSGRDVRSFARAMLRAYLCIHVYAFTAARGMVNYACGTIIHDSASISIWCQCSLWLHYSRPLYTETQAWQRSQWCAWHYLV